MAHTRTQVCLFLALLFGGPPLPSYAWGNVPTKTLPIYFDSTNHLHRDVHYHPETPERISACVKALEDFCQEPRPQRETIQLVDVAPLDDGQIGSPASLSDAGWEKKPFTDDELLHAKEMLLKSHRADLVLDLEKCCKLAQQKRLDEGKPLLGHMGYIDGGDTYVTTETFNVCLRATATWIRAVDVPRAVALTRPPGHHAERNNQNGFCLFNFAAAASSHILTVDPKAKVSVLDWDVHYGQGIADILQNEPRARYVSIHQTPAFPFMGESRKMFGEHKNIFTLPTPPETTWTCGYQSLFEEALDFICKKGEWEPDVVIVCAGYDALDSDELASCSLVAEDYHRMTLKLLNHLELNATTNTKQPRLMIGLEGGYQLNPSASGGNLPQAVVETVRALVEESREGIK